MDKTPPQGRHWRRYREDSLAAWITARLKKGDKIADIEATFVKALNAPPVGGWPNCRPSEYRLYDGSTWEDNPQVEPEVEEVILPFPSTQTAG